MTLSQPHDALFEAAMSDPRRAADLLRLVLPKTVFEKIHTASLRVESGSYRDEALAGEHSGLLLSADYADGPIFIYVLLEHKSSVDHWAPLQMLSYLVRVWKKQREQSSDGPLSPILPILISHADGGWTGPVRLGDLFGRALIAHPEVAPFVPDYQLVLEDLQRRDDASLRRAALDPGVVLALVALRDGRRANILATLRRHMAELKALASLRDALDLFSQLVMYLLEVPKDLSMEAFRAIMAEATAGSEDIMPTLAEQFRDEGRNEGRAEGRNEGRAEGRIEGEVAVLLKLLTRKFGESSSAIRDRLSGATTEEIERWAERILTATTAEEVFDDDGHEPH